ncbi:S-layer homology domain-containing protein [Paenibacillus sp. NPDC058174]|uniref:S-layer homology domain-containing protein n=1 Tax=Paenibacillus sp. NPDC058174 TaxID=3346366 RepID=UPI0036DE984A
MKKLCLLVVLITFCTSFSQTPRIYALGENDYTYTIANNEATITNFIRGAGVDITIPATLGGVPVTAIGELSFYITDLTSVVLHNGIKSIGDNAFGYNFLTSLSLPGSVTSLGQRAFSNNKLTSIFIPNSITNMEQEAFSNNLLTSIRISENLTSISDFAFRGNQLTSVVIPANITSIGGYTFRYNQLSSVVLMGKTVTIESNSFNNNQAVAADLKLFGYAGSSVQTYARNKGYTFVDGTSLFEAIASAKKLLKDHSPGPMAGQVPLYAHVALTVALSDAKAFVEAIRNTSTAADLNGAGALLQTAIQTFNAAIIQPDVTVLQAALTDANQALANHPAGTGVGETTAAARSVLQTAITAAQLVANNAGSHTQGQIDTAAAALRAAITAFEGTLIQAGDASDLDAVLGDANQMLADHPEGTGVGETTGAARAALQAAIDTAQAVSDDAAHQTQVQLDAASAVLRYAIDVFEDTLVQAGDAAALEALLLEAIQTLADHPEGTAVGETTSAARAAMQTAIDAAQAIADDAANQSEAQFIAAIAALNQALDQFEATWVQLVLQAPANGLYGKSAALTLTVHYGYMVTVSGTPTIPLIIGSGGGTTKTAVYNGPQGVPLNKLTFVYSLEEGLEDDITASSELVLPAGASITRLNGASAATEYVVPDMSGVIIASKPPVLTLSAGNVSSSGADVTVATSVSGSLKGNTLSALLWLPGSRSAAEFARGAGAGNDIIASEKFHVTSNGIYTVYAIDVLGNEAVQEITVSGIGTPSPGTGGEGQGPGGSGGAGNPGMPLPITAKIIIGGVLTEVRAVKETSADGVSAIKLFLTSEQLIQAFSKGQQQSVIAVEGLGSAVKIDLPADSLRDIASRQPNASIQVMLDGNSLHIPLQSAAGLREGSTFTVTMAPPSGKASADLQSAINKQGSAAVLQHPIVVALDTNGQTLANWQGIYLQRTIELTAKLDPNKATAVWLDADNRLHFVPSVFESDGKATIQLHRAGTYTIIESNRSFTDLQGHWAQADVELLANKWIAGGLPDGSFAPNHTITRAEFAALLVRALGVPETSAGLTFDDVKASDWYAGAVGAAQKAGLIGGFEDGSFRPNANITREQMSVMIARALAYAGSKPSEGSGANALKSFVDGEAVAAWAVGATEQLVGLGIIQGMTDTTFVPQANASRAQSAVMLKRMLQYLHYIN